MLYSTLGIDRQELDTENKQMAFVPGAVPDQSIQAEKPFPLSKLTFSTEAEKERFTSSFSYLYYDDDGHQQKENAVHPVFN